MNAARRLHPALRRNDSLRFHPVDNDALLCWSKRDPRSGDTVVCVVNLDPDWAQSGFVELDLGALGLTPGATFVARDLLEDTAYLWSSNRNFVLLDPGPVQRPRARARGRPRRGGPGVSPSRHEPPAAPIEPDWYKDAVIYELHVRAFADSNGDGRGDFRGLAGRLDYLQQLGVTAVWLLPFYPSPLRDDGYDIADYTAIHPDLGTLADFRHFVAEAHRRGIRVITELVLNHTSDQHPWFQRARRAAPGSYWRNFYVWSDTAERYQDARIIFQDFEQSNWAYDNVADAYYWHRFYSHQPDLNFRHEPVRRALLQAVDFWLRLGVDGLRLDAVPYLYEAGGHRLREPPRDPRLPPGAPRPTSTSASPAGCSSPRRTSGRRTRAPTSARATSATWRSTSRSCRGCSWRCGWRTASRSSTSCSRRRRSPTTRQWALFLRNHDELTLEMVTDEERDYMYRAYAADPAMRVNLGIRRRLAPLLQYHRQKIELMNGLLLSLPGTPVLYYGDEIGMGDNVFLGDRNGVRTPMQWSGDRNAGFSEANPQRLFLPVNIDPECHYESVNVEAQLDNPDSLLRWVRRLIALRGAATGSSAAGRWSSSAPTTRASSPSSARTSTSRSSSSRTSPASRSTSSSTSAASAAPAARALRETSFPPIGELPYLVTLSPHAFYWFELRSPPRSTRPPSTPCPSCGSRAEWWRVLEGGSAAASRPRLPAMLRARRWFGEQAPPDPVEHRRGALSRSGPAGTGSSCSSSTSSTSRARRSATCSRVAHLLGAEARELERDHPEALLARTAGPGGQKGCSSTRHAPRARAGPSSGSSPSAAAAAGSGGAGSSASPCTAAGRQLAELGLDDELPARVSAAEQSNTSIVAGDRDGGQVVLKSFRRLEPGENPEVEVGRHLARHRRPGRPPARRRSSSSGPVPGPPPSPSPTSSSPTRPTPGPPPSGRRAATSSRSSPPRTPPCSRRRPRAASSRSSSRARSPTRSGPACPTWPSSPASSGPGPPSCTPPRVGRRRRLPARGHHRPHPAVPLPVDADDRPPLPRDAPPAAPLARPRRRGPRP